MSPGLRSKGHLDQVYAWSATGRVWSAAVANRSSSTLIARLEVIALIPSVEPGIMASTNFQKPALALPRLPNQESRKSATKAGLRIILRLAPRDWQYQHPGAGCGATPSNPELPQRSAGRPHAARAAEHSSSETPELTEVTPIFPLGRPWGSCARRTAPSRMMRCSTSLI